MLSKCFLPSFLAISFSKLIFLFCLLTQYGCMAADSVKTQANPAMAAEMRQRDVLQTSVKPFYEINNAFLDVVQPKPPDGKMIVEFYELVTKQNAQRGFLDYFNIVRPVIVAYPGYFALFLFGLLLFILIPIIGIFWCSCRCCCHRCGAKSKPMDGRYARYRRGSYGVVLGVLCTLILAGSVLAFISNDLLHRPFKQQSPDNPVAIINSSLTDISLTLENIVKSINNQTLALLGKQVPLVKDSVKNASATAERDIVKLTNILGILSVWGSITPKITKYLTDVQNLEGNQTSFEEASKNFSTEVSSLTSTLTESINSNNETNTTECIAAKQALSTLEVKFNASNINWNVLNITKISLMSINITDVTILLQNVNDTLHNVSNQITSLGGSEIDNVIGKLNDSKRIEEYFVQISSIIANVTGALRQMNAVVNNGTFPGNKKLKPFLTQVDEIRMYSYIGVGSTVLLVVILYYLGLCFGACGEPPFEDARFCNRGVGAKFMSCGVGFTFLFFSIVMLVVTITFLVGGPVRTEFCRYALKQKTNGHKQLDAQLTEVFNKLNITLLQNFSYPPQLMQHILGDCQNHTSLVTAFGLGSLINGKLIYESDVKPSLNDLRKKIKTMKLNIDVESILTQTGKFIQEFQSFPLASFQSTIKELKKDVFPNFNEAVTKLRQCETSVTAKNGTIDFNTTIDSINKLILSFNAIRAPILAMFHTLSGVSNLQSEVAILRGEVKTFSQKVNPSSNQVNLIIDKAFNSLDATVKRILVDAVNSVLNEHASCKVLYEKATTIVRLICSTVLDPFNGFWLGIGWCLLILIPAMIFACKLNYLYKKTEYYVKDYEEPDYMSYQGFYPSDSIPLERVSSGMKLLGTSRGENYV